MADRECRNLAPHPAHCWHPTPFESPFRDVTHECAGVPGRDIAGQASSSTTRADVFTAEDQTPTALAGEDA